MALGLASPRLRGALAGAEFLLAGDTCGVSSGSALSPQPQHEGSQRTRGCHPPHLRARCTPHRLVPPPQSTLEPPRCPGQGEAAVPCPHGSVFLNPQPLTFPFGVCSGEAEGL